MRLDHLALPLVVLALASSGMAADPTSFQLYNLAGDSSTQIGTEPWVNVTSNGLIWVAAMTGETNHRSQIWRAPGDLSVIHQEEAPSYGNIDVVLHTGRDGRQYFAHFTEGGTDLRAAARDPTDPPGAWSTISVPSSVEDDVDRPWFASALDSDSGQVTNYLVVAHVSAGGERTDIYSIGSGGLTHLGQAPTSNPDAIGSPGVPQVLPNGRLAFTVQDGGGQAGQGGLRLALFDPASGSWDVEKLPDADNESMSMGISTLGPDGKIAVVWHTTREDIRFAIRDDVNSWRGPFTVNSIGWTPGLLRHGPAITGLPGGKFYFAWYERPFGQPWTVHFRAATLTGQQPTFETEYVVDSYAADNAVDREVFRDYLSIDHAPDGKVYIAYACSVTGIHATTCKNDGVAHPRLAVGS